jgi:hypothetical protein
MNKTDKKREENKEILLKALEKHLGIVSAACKEVNISRNTFYNYYNEDIDFKTAVDDINEITIDFVENQLLKNIKSGDRASIMFFMKYKGRKRGYSEHISIDANVKMEQPLLKPLDDEEKDSE